MAEIILGLGSNLGDRFTYLQNAIASLRESLGDLHCSSVYESPALLKPGAPEEWNRPFLNMAVRGQTTLSPEALLTLTQSIEAALGRPKQHVEWSPRVIDIDILTYDDVRMQTPTLTLPHPRLHERDFALLPFQELSSSPRDPRVKPEDDRVKIKGAKRIGSFL